MAIKEQFKCNVVEEITSKTGVTIASGQTLSSVLASGGTPPMGIFLPANWTAGNIGFLVSKDDKNFYTCCNFDGTAFTAAANPTAYIPLMPSMFHSVLFVKISSSIAQSTAVSVDFAMTPIYKGIN